MAKPLEYYAINTIVGTGIKRIFAAGAVFMAIVTSPPVLASTLANASTDISRFLIAQGWSPQARIVPIAGDASPRCYFRLSQASRSAILMQTPPQAQETMRAFVAIAAWLCAAGLSAPRLIAQDYDHGLLLIEDFGSQRMRDILDDAPHREAALYRGVVDVLIGLHRLPPMAGLAQHSLTAWLEELSLFIDYYCPAMGLSVDRDRWHRLWESALAVLVEDTMTSVVILRDYHAENIMLLESRSGVRHFGLLDFQDALCGHPAYDLASVLEDARRDVAPDIESAMLAYYITASGVDSDVFRRAYWLLAAQRNSRILGVFVRLWKRDNKPQYRRFQPRMWGLLERNLARGPLADLRVWFDENIPTSARASAWEAYQ